VTGTSWVQQLPFQAVPIDIASRVADLGYAGRYVPAGPGPEPIAGDFYDVLALDDDLVAITVGDVAGHGSTALARMQQLRAAVRAYAIQEPGPTSVISRLDVFCSRLDPESIATLWYGEYQPSTGLLRYAGAGHPPPVLTCFGDPTRLLELASAPPLGVGVVGQLATEHEAVLPVGAVLVAYSDGLVERHTANLDEQLELLRSLVTRAADPGRAGTAAEIAAELLDALVPTPDEAEDDVCLLVLRREPCADGDSPAAT
jgi:serine phosphatase RsbU (regulator of sigma subunit)